MNSASEFTVDDFLNTGKKAALLAGRFLLDNLEREKEVAFKGEGRFNPASQADRGAEEIILDAITRVFPEHSVVSEEKGEKLQSSEYTWLIDPLDGTVNYIHRHRYFSVSIALRRGSDIVLGIIYNPVLNEMFTAVKGRGAFLNDNNIRVSSVDRLGESLFSVSFPYDRNSTEFQDSLGCFARLARDAQAVRREGSTALSLCNVACGRFDGFCVAGNEVWDFAAGTLLVTEAGGKITDFRGQPFQTSQGRRLLASNGLIHEAVLAGFSEMGIS